MRTRLAGMAVLLGAGMLLAGSGARPRIGLTLSGGGSAALAHIGVLLWFEEHRIPVDVVSGASMGGLIGGFYATGMTAAHMKELVTSLDWEDLLRSGPPFSQMPAARKRYLIDHPGKLRLPMRGRVQIPAGLNPGDRLGLFLSRFTLPYTGTFDALPIPFRCTATDLVSGEAVVLSDGPLVQALRATMAYPGVFTPVQRNGMVLIDGGLLDQLPTGAARDMGADVVLAVNIVDKPASADAITSLNTVLNRAVSIVIQQNAKRSRKDATLVITPDTTEFASGDFRAVSSLVEAGYAAAEAQKDALSRYALSEQDWNEHIQLRRSRIRRVPEHLQFVDVAGLPPADTKALQQKLERSLDPVSLPDIEAQVTRFLASDRYPGAFLHMVERDDKAGIQAVFNNPASIHGTLSLNTRVDASEIQNVRLTTQAAFETAGPPSAAKWILDLAAGFESRATVTWRKPLGASGLTLVPEGGYLRRRTYIYDGRIRTSEVRIDRSGGGFDIELPSSSLFTISAGLHAWHDSVGARPFVSNAPGTAGAAVAPRITLSHNSQDDDLMPWRGWRVDATGDWMIESPGAARRYARATLDASGYQPLSKHVSLFAAAKGGDSFGRSMPFQEQFTLGGPLQLGAYRLDQFRGDRMALVASGVLYRPVRSMSLFDTSPTLAAWYEGGATARVGEPMPFRHTGTAGILATTPFGLLFVGSSWDGAGERRLYFTVGRFF